MTPPLHLDRRHFLRSAAALAAGGAATAVAGCTTSGAPTGTPGTSTGPAALPSFIPYEGVRPTLPALPNGTSAYFASFPANPATFLSSPPGAGGAVEGFTIANSAMKPAASNPHWQAVNTLLGVDLKVTGAPIGDFSKKFIAMSAGDLLPDFSCILPGETPQLAALLDAKFADLTDHLAGDAVKDYPALANIAAYNWAGAVSGQRIRMIPSPRFALFRQYLVRTDITQAAGIDPEPRSGAELAALLAALTDPPRKRFATISAKGLLDMVCEMMGVPNSWAVDDAGTFTRMYEDPRFPEALQFVADAWRQEQIHPEAFTPNLSTNATALYATDQSPLFPATPEFASIAIAAHEADPTARTEAITLHPWDGGEAPVQRWLGPGTFYFIGVRKADPERVKEILRIIDALASPFGTAEYLTIKYGRQGSDFTFTDGTVTLTDEGKANSLQPLAYLGAPAQVHYSTDAEAAKLQYEAEATAMEHKVARPNTGLESKTNESKGSQLDRVVSDAIAGIITGRTKVDTWPTVVSTWRSSGGDAIRSEYEQSWASNR